MSKSAKLLAAKPATVKGSELATTPDAKSAHTAHAEDRLAVLRALNDADRAAGDALIEAVRMTARWGQTSPEEVATGWPRCNNPGVYASNFNVGAKLAQAIGEKLALDTIDKAAALNVKGAAFQRVLEAGRAACKARKAAGEALDGRKAAAVVRDAVATAKSAAVERAAPKIAKAEPTRRNPTVQSATLAAASAESGRDHAHMAAFLLLAAQSASRMPEAEGREAAHRAAVKAVQDAAELWAVFK